MGLYPVVILGVALGVTLAIGGLNLADKRRLREVDGAIGLAHETTVTS